MDEEKPLPLLLARQWTGLMEGPARRMLENNILPKYLVRAKWFIPKERNNYQIVVSDYSIIPLDGHPVYWLLLEITGDDGVPGMYQLPLWIVSEDVAKNLAVSFPEALIAQVKSEEGDGILVDAFFVQEWQMFLLDKLAGQKTTHSGTSHAATPIVFEGTAAVKQYLKDKAEFTAKTHTSDLYNTSITYDGLLYLKLYRKVDRATNPDQELTRFLSKEAKFPYLPAFIGSIEWKDRAGCIVLGLLQEMIENHGDGYGYFQERITNYIERMLVGEKDGPMPQERLGTLAEPKSFDELPAGLHTLLGVHASEQARLIGIRTAELHLALASGMGKDMKPEPFSLYYQRSLYSSITSLVRETYQNLSRYKQSLPPAMQERLERIIAYRSELLTTLKRIYAGKMEVSKIRIHGNFHLGQVLLTGKDLAISDYSGDSSLSFSERRLRRSVFVDLSSMITSIYEVAFDGFMNNHSIHTGDTQQLLPMAGLWAHYISGFFILAYKQRAQGSVLIPASAGDFEALLQYFLVQKSMTVFNTLLKNDPKRIIIPQTILREVLRPQDAQTAETAETTAAPTIPDKEIVQPKPADIEAEKVVAH
jgi:maltose alpha-D-glucosyltransferase/alpha-amylase